LENNMSAIDQAFIRAYQPDEPNIVSTSSAEPAGVSIGHASRGRTQQSGDRAYSRRAPHFQLPPDAAAELPAADDALAQRRPLSAFAQPGPTVEARFKPALEVDRFRWSPVCDELVHRHFHHLRPALHTLLAADDAGRSLIGVGAAASGLGCTTVVSCLARLLVGAGKSVAIVDGNFAAPGLATHLGLAVETGWEDVLAGSVPLAESVVYSLADRLALLPQRAGGAAAAEKLESIHSSVTAGVLRYHYDMVLVDLGPLVGRIQGPIACRLAAQCRLDGVLFTIGANAANSQRHMQIAPELASICFGVVENQTRAA